MAKVRTVSDLILQRILSDFQGRQLQARDLQEGYEGVSIADIKQQCLADDPSANDVDFDLALNDIESAGLISTGPMTAYDNPPDSSVVVLGFFSKREWACLTAKGYKTAR